MVGPCLSYPDDVSGAVSSLQRTDLEARVSTLEIEMQELKSSTRAHSGEDYHIEETLFGQHPHLLTQGCIPVEEATNHNETNNHMVWCAAATPTASNREIIERVEQLESMVSSLGSPGKTATLAAGDREIIERVEQLERMMSSLGSPGKTATPAAGDHEIIERVEQLERMMSSLGSPGKTAIPVAGDREIIERVEQLESSMKVQQVAIDRNEGEIKKLDSQCKPCACVHSYQLKSCVKQDNLEGADHAPYGKLFVSN